MNIFQVEVNGEQLTFEDAEKSASSVALLQQEISTDGYGLTKMDFKDGDVVLDVGAHIGSVSIILAKLFPNIRILAFEPAKTTYDLLVKNIEANNVSNVLPIKAAVSDKVGSMELCFNPNDTAGSSACYTPSMKRLLTENQWVSETVDCLNMKEIFKLYNINHVSWLKLDCEGAEFAIFDDPENQFEKIDSISMEVHFPVSQFARGLPAIRKDFYDKLKKYDPQPELNIVNINWMLDSNI